MKHCLEKSIAFAFSIFPILFLLPALARGQAMTTVHPAFSMATLRPSGFNPQVSGLDFLPDGRLVVCDGANPDGTVTVTARVNFANDFSDKFVGRDSPQAATQIVNDCANTIPNPFQPGSVSHCGGVSQWNVASGGRMGQVMGEDSTEIAPKATACTADCTAQDQVQGRAVVVGFPFTVPDAVRLNPRFFPGFVLP